MSLQQFGGANAVSCYASSIFVDAGFSVSIGTISLALIGVKIQFSQQQMATVLEAVNLKFLISYFTDSWYCLECALS